MSLQFVDYPMDNHRLPFSEVRDACGARRSKSITFGAVVAFVSGLPILNLILIQQPSQVRLCFGARN